MSLRWDTGDLERLEYALLESAVKAHTEAPDVVKQEAQRLRNDWRDNARRTAGRHGKHYPSSITMEQEEGATWEVGPDSAYPQGGMGRGFEYGSVNQPPHLDGMRAAMAAEPRLEKAVEDWAARLL